MGREKDDTIGIKHGKPDLIRIGMFSEPLYISSGEAYTPKKGVSSLDYRANGKQFLTAPPRKGHDTKDVYFNQAFVRLFENEPYMDLVKLRRSWRLQAKEKNIVPAPFKPSSVPSKSSGKGSHWGTIEQQFPMKGNEKLALPPKPEVKEEKKKGPVMKNFLTAPSKKGSGYGYANVTIGKYYPYESDPYDLRVVVERKERNESKKKMVEEKPFVSQIANHEFFNPFARLTKADKVAKNEASGEEKQKPISLIPFKPSSVSGYTINPYPIYEPPKTAMPKAHPSAGKNMIFKPSGVTGSFPIRSIIESNTPIAPPSWVKSMQEKVNLGGSN